MLRIADFLKVRVRRDDFSDQKERIELPRSGALNANETLLEKLS